ncbi:hypothetical protein [Pigmentibacter ruber]|uniref:hypothetical protein n=1 Tax=Pigmentibacter ruber TaxID=2683196 RepID=UPI00131D5BA6|nr:hypothetical protein [Pigmentibacter ruber]
MNLIILLIFLFQVTLLIIALAGVIYPKSVIIWYFKGKDRLYYAYAVLFIVLSFFVLACFYDDNETSIPENEPKIENNKNVSIKSEKYYLVTGQQFENRYDKYKKISESDILELNTKIQKNNSEFLVVNMSKYFTMNLKIEYSNNVNSLEAKAILSNENSKSEIFTSTFTTLIYATEPSMLTDNAKEVFTQLYNDSLLNKKNNIYFGKYKLNNIEYNLIHTPNDYMQLKIFNTLNNDS